MKKEYVKPVMEGEAFVANEYVATCYTIICDNNCGYVETKSLDGVGNHGTAKIYTGTIGEGSNKDGCEHYDIPREVPTNLGDYLWYKFLEWLFGDAFTTEGTVYYHPVSVKDTWIYNTANPNSSV